METIYLQYSTIFCLSGSKGIDLQTKTMSILVIFSSFCTNDSWFIWLKNRKTKKQYWLFISSLWWTNFLTVHCLWNNSIVLSTGLTELMPPLKPQHLSLYSSLLLKNDLLYYHAFIIAWRGNVTKIFRINNLFSLWLECIGEYYAILIVTRSFRFWRDSFKFAMKNKMVMYFHNRYAFV